jgi:hypothetical protein
MGTKFNHSNEIIIFLIVVSLLISVTAIVASGQRPGMNESLLMSGSSIMNGLGMNEP